jgi:2-polyprenyl-6-hydroxyphenyl methylase/3-demethylubiquinone-9 3-methyltransferase
MTRTANRANRTVDAREVERFASLAAEWWDPHGKFRPLHELNPLRLRFIRDQLAGHFGRDSQAPRPLLGLRIVDVGCGGGLLCEPLARLGARVVGIDPAEESIAVAGRHAASAGLAIDYRATTAEALAAAGETFDAVLALELIEHVADADALIDACSALLRRRATAARPAGAMVLATLNRTAKSYTLAILGAERLLRWLPVGTHDWGKFRTPDELAAMLGRNGLEFTKTVGIVHDPLALDWRFSRDLSVNYLGFAVRG